MFVASSANRVRRFHAVETRCKSTPLPVGRASSFSRLTTPRARCRSSIVWTRWASRHGVSRGPARHRRSGSTRSSRRLDDLPGPNPRRAHRVLPPSSARRTALRRRRIFDPVRNDTGSASPCAGASSGEFIRGPGNVARHQQCLGQPHGLPTRRRRIPCCSSLVDPWRHSGRVGCMDQGHT